MTLAIRVLFKFKSTTKFRQKPTIYDIMHLNFSNTTKVQVLFVLIDNIVINLSYAFSIVIIC